MATIIYPHTFVPNTPARASEVNANFDAITDEVNGNLDADNLADNAVTTAKIADGAVTDAKVTSVGATKVTGTLTNAQLASGIDASKLTTGTLPVARIAAGAVTPEKTSFLDTWGSSAAIAAGQVNSAGAGVVLPTGWSSARAGTGSYTLTHPMGASAVLVVTPVEGAVAFRATVNPLSTTVFQVFTWDASSSLNDSAFMFFAARV